VEEEFTNRVRLHVLDRVIETTRVPRIAETAEDLGRLPADVAAAHRRLAETHVYVLEPGSDEVRMANPFSAVPTPFEVEVGGRRWFGNCIWDSLGIVALLGANGTVLTRCPDCDATLELEIRKSAVRDGAAVAHFAVPAAKWWDDIVYT
jgi:hypothetical protein